MGVYSKRTIPKTDLRIASLPLFYCERKEHVWIEDNNLPGIVLCVYICVRCGKKRVHYTD
jgi:hypothetical protein